MIDPNKLEKYPNHTDEIERLESEDSVDTIVPKHFGGEERRFCLSFLLISGSLAKLFALTGDSDNLCFEPVYEFSLQNDYNSYGELWNSHVLFRWEDRIEADKAQKTANLYARRFTLGEEIPEEKIPELVQVGSWGEKQKEVPECQCDNQSTIRKEVSQLALTVDICENCKRPYRLITEDSSATLYRTSMELGWIEGDWGAGTEPLTQGGLRFYEVKGNDTPTSADATLHGLTRESQLEFPNFGYYRGDQQSGLLIGDPEIGKEGEIVGYLHWNQPGTIDRPCLQQVYLRPDYRGQNYGKQLLKTWLDHYIDDHRYFAVDVSDQGMGFLRSCGHITDDRDCPAIPVEAWTSWDTDGRDVAGTAASETLRKQGY